MSCLSRLLGLVCAIVPGLLFLAFSVLFFQRWPQLGAVTGSLYTLASFITGAVCLYLGVSILFGRDPSEEAASTNPKSPSLTPSAAEPVAEPKPLQAAPLPTPVEAVQPVQPEVAVSTQSIFASTQAPASLDTPESRIRQLATTRPHWQVTAPQLAQLTNLNMNVADATAREMVSRGQAQLQTGPNGETIFIFDLAGESA